jgi:gamma-D-glutamyl-L-lysine dipeptidyl-peptidase
MVVVFYSTIASTFTHQKKEPMNATATCLLSAIPMRKEPSDRSEMVNQMLHGESCSIIDQNDKWYLVELHHDLYQGWVDKKQIQASTLPLIASAAMVRQPIWKTKKENGQPLWLPAGAFYDPALLNAEEPISTVPMDQLAKAFLGSPYLWGGRTAMGIDCSGFTQLVYRLKGLALPRDAYQQAEKGDLVSFLDEAQTGDLAFFDNSEGKITHVGIVLDDPSNGSFKSIIHASGEVRIDPLDSQGILVVAQEKYSHQLRTIRRIM